MGNIYYLKDSKKFWETRRRARETKDKKLASLPFSEKVAITEELQADYEVLRDAKEKVHQFGLGVMSPDTMNEISIEQPFTQDDFEEILNRLFPFTQEIQAGQESLKTQVDIPLSSKNLDE